MGAVPAAARSGAARAAPTTLFRWPLPIQAKTLIAPSYTVELGDRAVCHRNASFGTTEAVFLSTRLVEDRFGLAFEFFINVAHNFVDAAGVPESFARPHLVAGRGAGTRRNQPGCLGSAAPRAGLAQRAAEDD